jgi:hypothetical protein
MQLAARALEARAAFTGKEPCLTLDNAKIAASADMVRRRQSRAHFRISFRSIDETFQRMAVAYRAAGLL